jgi:DNA-binding winged helix-turn-helix (wHTH) protein
MVHFGPFTLDASSRTLQSGASPLHLSPKAFELLTFLVRCRPAAVSKADIHQHLWPDTFVTDGNVAVLVAEIRRALGDSGRNPQFVRTVQRFGYAFAADALTEQRADRSRREPSQCWIVWATERVRLGFGQNVLGRDLAADVLIDAVGVSRRHAMIVVGPGEATLVDLSSKNGTFADNIRVQEPVQLFDDVEIRLGPVPVRFCTLPAPSATQTWDAAHPRKVR